MKCKQCGCEVDLEFCSTTCYLYFQNDKAKCVLGSEADCSIHEEEEKEAEMMISDCCNYKVRQDAMITDHNSYICCKCEEPCSIRCPDCGYLIAEGVDSSMRCNCPIPPKVEEKSCENCG